MVANAENLRRAGLLLRAMAGSAGWTAGAFVDSRQVAKDKAIAASEKELSDIEGYLLGQGWIAADDEASRGENRYTLTRHGLDEAQRKQPAEAKVYKPQERVD